MLPHAVDGPAVHGVIDHELFLGLATEQLVERQSGRLAENVPLRDVDGGEHARLGAAPWLVGDAIEKVLPESLNRGRILPEDVTGQLLQGAAMRVVARIGFAD